MMEYVLPEIPEHYWIKKCEHKCRKCESIYDYLRPDEGVIKLSESCGAEIKWMPILGVRGYFYFAESMISEYQTGQPIPRKSLKPFHDELSRVLEVSSNGHIFVIDNYEATCPNCGSADYVELSESLLKNPELDWIKVTNKLQFIE